jgi:hypothetical protein
MRGIIPPFPQYASWRGAKLKAQGQLNKIKIQHLNAPNKL